MSDRPPPPDDGRPRPIVRWGEELLHRPLRPVDSFDPPLRDLVADMFATMYAADGLGLAASQIGVDLQVFVYDCPDDGGVVHRGAICNPTVTLPSGRKLSYDKDEEGCLSLPGAFVPCKRPTWAMVDGYDLDGRPRRVSGTGLFARCLQHEADHCRGVVFGDLLGHRARRRLYRDAATHSDDYPPSWPADGRAGRSLSR